MRCASLRRFRQLQLGTDSQVAELSNQAKLHAFKAERAQMVKEEMSKALAQCQVECEKQQKKLEVLKYKDKMEKMFWLLHYKSVTQFYFLLS